VQICPLMGILTDKNSIELTAKSTPPWCSPPPHIKHFKMETQKSV
jgi:hypothetical protein